jgi:hypothetical protein
VRRSHHWNGLSLRDWILARGVPDCLKMSHFMHSSWNDNKIIKPFFLLFVNWKGSR